MPGAECQTGKVEAQHRAQKLSASDNKVKNILANMLFTGAEEVLARFICYIVLRPKRWYCITPVGSWIKKRNILEDMDQNLWVIGKSLAIYLS